MEPGIVTILRSKWLAIMVHLALWALFALAVSNIGGTAPTYYDVPSASQPSPSLAQVARIDKLLATDQWPARVIDTNLPSPFFTTAFVPAQKPSPKPAPPPTTRKVIIVYQGYFTSAGGPKTAMIKMQDGISTTPLGSPIVTNHFIADLTHNTMTLTNPAGQTNLLLLNTAKELEIPIK